jgi:chromosome segregation ATPase
MTDRNLEEAIFQLQKLNTENGVKQLAEEAALLYADGHQIEAGALMEKAEAMMAASKAGAAHASPHTPNAAANPRPARSKAEEQAIASMAGKLADGLAKILLGAFQELEIHIVGESRRLSTSFEQQLTRLHTAVESLGQLKVRFEHLAESVSEQQTSGLAIGQKYDQLSAAVTSLQDASTRHETEIGALRGETGSLREKADTLRGETTALRDDAKKFTTGIIQQMDGLAARLGLQQEDLSGLKATVSDISRKVGGFGERLDRQAEIIRSLSDSQTRRAEVLDELLGVLTRLKTPVEPLAAAAAGHL